MSGTSAEAGRFSRILGGLAEVLASWRFPVLALTVVTGVSLAMLAVLFIPDGDGALAAFAEDFKIWCFGYDPATGKLESAYVGVIAVQPPVIGLMVAVVWWRPLREGFARARRGVALWASAGLGIVVGAALLIALISPARADGELPFPAEEIRTAYTPPPVKLTRHDGTAFDLAAHRGKVVLVTAVYARCGMTCPTIMGQTKQAVASLSPEDRDDLRVVAITLDPEHDTVERLAALADAQDIAAPTFSLLTGPAAEVESTLDALQFARQKNPETGVIDHANLFLLVDREGRLAYRLSLGDRSQRWLESALRLLLRES